MNFTRELKISAPWHQIGIGIFRVLIAWLIDAWIDDDDFSSIFLLIFLPPDYAIVQPHGGLLKCIMVRMCGILKRNVVASGPTES